MLIDETSPRTPVPHPIHLHGYKFFVVAMERHVDDITHTFLGRTKQNKGGPSAFRWQNQSERISTAQILLAKLLAILFRVS